jgi:Trk K+ transport system NAD-binding subunit
MLKELLLPKQALVSAIKRGEKMIIPDGNTKIQAGDQITIIGKTDDVEKVYKRFTSA